MSTTLPVAAVAAVHVSRAAAIADQDGALGVIVVSARSMRLPEHVAFFGLAYLGP